MADKETNFSDMVSANSKRILWALFILVIVILLVFTITVRYNPDLSDRLNTVFIAAISGMLALGGTLITQLWGKRKDVQDTLIAELKAEPPEIKSGEKSILDASSSKNYDTITIEQKQPAAGVQAGTLKKIDETTTEFTAPSTQQVISFEFTAIAKKGDKKKEKPVSIKVSPPSSQTTEDTLIAELKAEPPEIKSGEKSILDASSSKNYDTITIEQKQPAAGVQAGTLKKIDETTTEFTAPSTQQVISFEFTAIAKKGDKKKEKPVSIKVSPPSSQTTEDTLIAELKAEPPEIKSGEKSILDASSSKNYDTITIEQKQPAAGVQAGTLKKIDETTTEFTAPSTQQVISFEFTAIAKKGDKKKEKPVSIKVSPSGSP